MTPQPAACSIRRLTSDDAPLMQALLATFGEAFDDVETYASARPRPTYLASLLGGESFVALAALKRGAVVGGLAAYELRRFEQERSEVYIYDLTVAAARGAWVIYVQADLADLPAIALYSKLGAREDVLHFDIAVE